MYSLNVPLPTTVPRRAENLAMRLPRSHARPRGEHTLVVKRLGGGDATDYSRYESRAREAVAGMDPFSITIDHIEVFEEPASGEAPVVYFAVDAPALELFHQRLCEHFDPVEDMEGDEYVPHVTIARGGDIAAAQDLVGPIDDPIEWTVESLECYDAERSVPASRISLPA